MKILAICSYICSVAAIVLGVYTIVLAVQSSFTFAGIILQLLLFLIPGIAQYLHTMFSNRIYSLQEFKETKSLDDFLLNEIGTNEYVVATSYWQKIFSVVNCVLLCIAFIFISSLFKSFLSELSRMRMDNDYYVILLIFVIYLMAIPTLLFNLRTFNLKRIKS